MLVVNLTTTSTRLELCGVTLWSLIHQSCLPDRIDLWISKEPFMSDQGIHELPEWLDELNGINRIINVRYVENTGPYRKIFPALQSTNDSDIHVYADDDVVYGHSWLKSLTDCFLLNEGKFVVASRVRIMRKNLFGHYQSYDRFNICLKPTVVKKDFVITGVGGCILKKSHIDPALLTNSDYLQIAPRTDDFWISKLLELSGTSVMICPDAFGSVQEIVHTNFSLNQTNTLMIKGRGFSRLLMKIRVKVLGYFGLSLSNNDFARKRISNYFSNKK